MTLKVDCVPATDGYTCQVEVSEAGSRSDHTVLVRRADLDLWAQGRSAEELVRQSFDFLLAREPKESILKEFELSMIPRYFREYDQAIRRQA